MLDGSNPGESSDLSYRFLHFGPNGNGGYLESQGASCCVQAHGEDYGIGCTLLHDNIAQSILSDPAGNTAVSVPNNSTQLGAVVRCQARCVSPGVNSVSLVLSNGLALVIGNR